MGRLPNQRGESKNFYIDRLRLLFFAGLNNYQSEDVTAEPEARRLIGVVPFSTAASST